VPLLNVTSVPHSSCKVWTDTTREWTISELHSQKTFWGYFETETPLNTPMQLSNL